MPSLVPDPDRALLDRLAATEARLQALEMRRRVGRAYGWYQGGNGTFYALGAPRTILWDQASIEDPVSAMNPFAGTYVAPFNGAYEVTLVLGAGNVGTTVTAALFRTNTGTTLASRDLAIETTDRYNPWIHTVNLSAQDIFRVTIQPLASFTMGEAATLIVRQVG